MTQHTPHPGEILRDYFIDDGAWSLADVARLSGVPEWRLVLMYEGVERLQPADCDKLAHAFNMAPAFWRDAQAAWDAANPPRGAGPRLAYALGIAAGMADSLQWHGVCSRLFNAGDGMSREMAGRGFDRGQRVRVPGAWWR